MDGKYGSNPTAHPDNPKSAKKHNNLMACSFISMVERYYKPKSLMPHS